MLLTVERKLPANSLEKITIAPGELVVMHFQPAPEAPWESYSMSGRFLMRVLQDYQTRTEAERSASEVLSFKPINGHSFEGVEKDMPENDD